MESNFGKILEVNRKKIGITQEELAKKTKIERTYMSRLESSKSNPSFKKIKVLCDGLGITLAEFFSGIEQEKQPAIIEMYSDAMSKKEIKDFRIKAELIPVKVTKDLNAFSRNKDIKNELSSKYIYVEKLMFKNPQNIFGIEIVSEFKFSLRTLQNPIFLVDVSKLKKMKFGDYYIVEPDDKIKGTSKNISIRLVDLLDEHIIFSDPSEELGKPRSTLFCHKLDFNSDVIRGKVVGLFSRL